MKNVYQIIIMMLFVVSVNGNTNNLDTLKKNSFCAYIGHPVQIFSENHKLSFYLGLDYRYKVNDRFALTLNSGYNYQKYGERSGFFIYPGFSLIRIQFQAGTEVYINNAIDDLDFVGYALYGVAFDDYMSIENHSYKTRAPNLSIGGNLIFKKKFSIGIKAERSLYYYSLGFFSILAGYRFDL